MTNSNPNEPKKESSYNLQNSHFGGGFVNADTVNVDRIGGDTFNLFLSENEKPYRKRWRKLEVLTFPLLSDTEESRAKFINYLAYGLKQVFEKKGYTEFISLISKCTVMAPEPIVAYKVVSHKVEFCHSVRKSYQNYVQDIMDIKSAGFSEDEKAILKEDMKMQISWENSLAEWSIYGEVVSSSNPVAHKFIFDPDTQHISISINTESRWKDELSTSDLMTILSVLLNSNAVVIQRFENLSRIPKLIRLLTNIMDKKPINLNDFRINVDDDEDWDYFAAVKEAHF